jgi:hypothetical protein
MTADSTTFFSHPFEFGAPPFGIFFTKRDPIVNLLS